jgi:hypothetical protein
MNRNLFSPLFLTGNLWLLVCLALFVGQHAERSQPTRYSFFGKDGAWLSPTVYTWLLLLTGIAGMVCLTFAFISIRQGARGNS